MAERINEEYFETYYENETKAIRDINKYAEQIRNLELSTRKKYEITYLSYVMEEGKEKSKQVTEKVSEAQLVQMFGEKRIEYDTLKQTGVDIEKIENAVRTFRKIYDEVLEKVNKTLIKNGLEPVAKRQDYFPHFTEDKPDTVLEKIGKLVNMDLTGEELPTDIAGKTQTFKPNKKYVGNFKERKTNVTDFDALKGFDNYIRGVTDVIYHTSDIMNMRALNESVREFYNEKEIKKKIEEIDDNDILTEEEKKIKKDEIKKNAADKSHLSNFVNWFENYINILAGKKSINDRSSEKEISRKMYRIMTSIENRMAANMIGGNIGVAISNTAVLAQATAEIKGKNLTAGILGSLWSNGKGLIGRRDMSFASESNFITRRRGADTTYENTFDKVVKPVNAVINAVDEVVSEAIVRGKYMQNLEEGMTQQEALKEADRYTAGLMADRSKGALPTAFNSTNPLAKMFTMFQVEVNNQYSYLLKDLPQNMKNNKIKIAYGLTKTMIASYLMNEMLMKIRGNATRLLPDPIGWVVELLGGLLDDDEDNDWETIWGTGIDVAGNIPFVSFMVAIAGPAIGADSTEVGRIPITGAIPNLNKIGNALADKEYSWDYKKQVIGKEIMKPVYNLALPMGGSQIKKSTEAIKTLIKGESTVVDKNGNETMQFPVEEISLPRAVQSIVLGKYTLPNAKEYMEREYKVLNEKQTKMYRESKLSYKEITEYIDTKFEGKNQKEQKIKYLEEKNMTAEQKWAIYKYDIFSRTEREKDGGNEQSDAEYIISKGVSKEAFIKSYNEAERNNIGIPTKSEYDELLEIGINFETYVKYKTQIAKETKKQRTEGIIKETESLKNVDKCQIILNGDYTTKERLALYKQYVNTEDKKIILVEELGFPINEYIRYKTNNFKNDKNEDGEIIKGSKKEKVLNYLNNIPDSQLSQNYKKIIAKIEDINDKDYNRDIVNFINNYKGISGAQRKEILEAIGFDIDKKRIHNN